MTIKERIGKWFVDQLEKRGLTVIWKDAIPEPIKTHGCANFWYDHGMPRKPGAQIKVKMASGAVAVFELTEVSRAIGVDWDWYTLHFVRYLADEPQI